MTLLEATNQNARAVSLPPGCLTSKTQDINMFSKYIYIYIYKFIYLFVYFFELCFYLYVCVCVILSSVC